MQRILVTGATGKVGQAFIGRLLSSSDDRFTGFTVRALCHNRALGPDPRVEVVTCLLYTSPSPRDRQKSRMPSSA